MPRKDAKWIEKSGLYGTWTFTTETMTDIGYYKGIAYVVMHLMPDPMQVQSCSFSDKKHCKEIANRACSHGGANGNENQICVNTETTELEWSDVTAFFEFGFILREGIVKKSYHRVSSGDWLGPYNLIMAPADEKHEYEDTTTHTKKKKYVSRYVKTPWTNTELQRPYTTGSIFNFNADELENIVGTKAINSTIYEQINWMGDSGGDGSEKAKLGEMLQGSLRGDDDDDVVDADHDDPYARYARSCAHGDLHPVLPKLQVEQITKTTPAGPGGTPPEKSKTTYSLKVDYSILSIPQAGIDDLYKKWPSFKSHLGGKFPLTGPYCYGKDPSRAYTIRLSYDSSPAAAASQKWSGIKGCNPSWPCWKNDLPGPAPPPSAQIPTDNGAAGSYVLDPKGIEAVIVYAMGFLLVVSLVFNLLLANRLRRSRQQRNSDDVPEQPRPRGNTQQRDLEEPLLGASDDDMLSSAFDDQE